VKGRHDREGAPARPAAEEPGPARRPYERPRILWRQPLEAMATECDTVPGGKGDVTCTIAFS
jgi:hypothetical protein